MKEETDEEKETRHYIIFAELFLLVFDHLQW